MPTPIEPPGTASLTCDGRAWLLALEGEHDLATVPLLDLRMEQVCASGADVVIDLSRATFIDCSVVGWIVRFTNRAGGAGHPRLSVAAGADGSFARRLFDLVDPNRVIPRAATRDAAAAGEVFRRS